MTRHAHYRNIELVGTLYNLRFPPISNMRQEAIGEAVQAFICMSIWEDTGFQERQTNNVIVNVMSILTIIEQADTVSPFAQINPSMSTGLKSRQVPRCVTVCGAFNVAKLDFIRCSRTVDCQRKRRLQQRLVLVPVNLGGNVDARRVAPERDTLRYTRGHVRTDNLDGCTHWSLFEDTQRCYCLHRIRLLLIKKIDIPGVEIQGTILISNELVACLPGGKNVTLRTHVVELGDLSFRINLEVIIVILQDSCLIISVGSATRRWYLCLTDCRIACWRYNLHSTWGNAHAIQQGYRVSLPVSCLLGMRKR